MPMIVNPSHTGKAFDGSTKTKPGGFHDLSISTNAPWTDNAFHVKHVNIQHPAVTGADPNGAWVSQWPANLADYYTRPCNIATDSNDSLGARLLANTSPTRPEVLTRSMFVELAADIWVLAHAGELILKSKRKKFLPKLRPDQIPAAINLSIQFGIMPLVNDLKSLVNFNKLMSKRMGEIDRLNSGSGLKRRLGLGTWDMQDGFTTGLSGRCSIRPSKSPIQVTGSFTKEVWGTVRWKPTPFSSDSPFRRKVPVSVAQAILGMRAGHITLDAWELLPFSWLVDYFTNIGDWLQGHSGSMTAQPSLPCIMRHTTGAWTSPAISRGAYIVGGSSGSYHTIPPGSIRVDEKDRQVSSVNLAFDFPILSGRQLSILGSLAVLKYRG